MKNNILRFIISYWIKNFKGITSDSISESLSIPILELNQCLDELENEHLLSINRDIELGRLSFEQIDGKFEMKTDKFITNMIFPTKLLLGQHFERNLSLFKSNGEFKNRLIRGYQQISSFYFDYEVLSKYIKNKDKYLVEDDVTGGIISRINSESEYLRIRYGKRKLENGNTLVTTILIDLANIPIKEQKHWESYESNDSDFLKEDVDYSNYTKRNFEGEWVDSNDPLDNIKLHLNEINELLEMNLFIVTENNHLCYPTIDNFKSMCESFTELYILIGPDNLNSKVLKYYLKKYFNINSKDLFNKDSKRAYSKLQLLDLLLNKLEYKNANKYLELINNVKYYRVENAHKVTPIKPGRNFIDTFKEDCYVISNYINEIKDLLSKFKGNGH